MAQHLEKCVVYQSRIAEEKGGPTQQKLNLKQQPLRVRSISKEEQEKLEKKAGYAIYCGARIFNVYGALHERLHIEFGTCLRSA